MADGSNPEGIIKPFPFPRDRSRLLKATTANMAEYERSRHPERKYDLVFPRGPRADLEADVRQAVATDPEVWAWRTLDGPQYPASVYRSAGFRYAFNGAFMVACRNLGAWWLFAYHRITDLRLVPARTLDIPEELRGAAGVFGWERDLKATRQSPKTFLPYLVYRGTEAVGLFTLVYGRGIAGLYNVVVRDDLRGQGIGTKLVALAVRTAFLAKSYLILQCHPSRQRFYARNGFHYLGATDAWRYRKDVEPEKPSGLPAGWEDFLTAISTDQTERVKAMLARTPGLLHARFPSLHEATPLHIVAWLGYADLTRYLLEIGADPTVTDAQFRATPAGWARHGNRPETVALLHEANRDA